MKLPQFFSFYHGVFTPLRRLIFCDRRNRRGTRTVALAFLSGQLRRMS
jgi:hypothetical protein